MKSTILQPLPIGLYFSVSVCGCGVVVWWCVERRDARVIRKWNSRVLSGSDPTTENSGRKKGECHSCHPRSLRQEEYKFKAIQGYRVRPYFMVGGGQFSNHPLSALPPKRRPCTPLSLGEGHK